MFDDDTDFWSWMPDMAAFSFFRKPIQNTEPCRAITVVDVYRYVVGHYAKVQTETLRAMTSLSEAKKYKATHFNFCTFSGLFRKRSERELIQHSGLMCIDFDHIGDSEALKARLLEHEYFETELMFTSPSGDGVKWIIPVELRGWEHSRFFKAVTNCLKATGLPPVDMLGSDVARACFLPYDPQAYINPKYDFYARSKENFFSTSVAECPF